MHENIHKDIISHVTHIYMLLSCFCLCKFKLGDNTVRVMRKISLTIKCRLNELLLFIFLASDNWALQNKQSLVKKIACQKHQHHIMYLKGILLHVSTLTDVPMMPPWHMTSARLFLTWSLWSVRQRSLPPHTQLHNVSDMCAAWI